MNNAILTIQGTPKCRRVRDITSNQSYMFADVPWQHAIACVDLIQEIVQYGDLMVQPEQVTREMLPNESCTPGN
jgi:hypothetical protein